MIKRWAEHFFRWFCHPDYYPDIQGDLEEIYGRNLKQGNRFAQWEYLFQVVGLLRPSLIRSFPQYLLMNPVMFKNYLVLMVRALKKFKLFAAINIIGFSTSISLALFAIFSIFNEVNYDTFHKDYKNIYRVTTKLIYTDGSFVEFARVMPWVGPRLMMDLPEVEAVGRFMQPGAQVIDLGDTKFKEEKVMEVDSSFFEVFGFDLKSGDKKQVLHRPFSAVLTQEIAEKYFGTENPMGKNFKMGEDTYTVTGIVENGHINSHFSFDILYSTGFLDYDWEDSNIHRMMFVYTYARFREGLNYNNFKSKLESFEDRYLTSNDLEEAGLADWKLLLQSITDIHIGSNMKRELEENIDMSTLYLISAVSLIIILVAGLNYIVLMSAIYTNRRKEIGIQKVFGAEKRNFVTQFMGESLLFVFTSLIIAIVLLRLEISWFGNLFYDRVPNLDIFFHPLFILIVIGLTLLVGIFGGIYPSISLASIKTIDILNNKVNKGNKNSFLLQLMGMQAAITILIISFSYIIVQQLQYFNNKDHGFDKDRIIVVEMPWGWDKYDAFKAELLKLSNVEKVSKSMNYPGGFIPENVTVVKDGATKLMTVNVGCEDYIETMGFELVQGRDFLMGDDWESGGKRGVILNESAVKEFGWEDPIGQTVKTVQQRGVTDWSFQVVGVVKDFHNASLRQKIEPTRIQMMCSRATYILIKTKDRESKFSVIPEIKRIWGQMDNALFFDYFFLEDVFTKLYEKETRLSNIFSLFAIIAVVISIMGVFAISSITAKSKTKEIGIRKTLGASVSDIFVNIVKRFSIVILITSMISLPLIYFITKKWLSEFAYSVDVSFLNYLLPCLVVFVVTFIALSYHTIQASLTDPAKVLRTE